MFEEIENKWTEDSGDYDDMFDWAEEDVKPLFNRTELLIKKMKSLLSLVE